MTVHVAVVAGGPVVDLAAALGAGVDGWTVVAADSGVAAVRAAGLVPDVVVGDLDSIDPTHLAAVEAAGARIDRHPVEKDATDLELALDAAVALRPGRILVVIGLDGREDHALAGALLLASPRYAAVPRVEARIGDASVVVVRGGDEVAVVGAPGDLVSILPVHGDAEGVTTEGLRYPLRDEPLPAGTTRGVSNEVVAQPASVALRSGTVLVVLPGAGRR